MARQPDSRIPLRWTGGYFREPVWPSEIDLGAVRSVAKIHLQAEIPTSIEDDLLEVSFFAEGLYNKLYKISHPQHHPSYLLRVTVPVAPYYKTESEVATIAYLRANASVPVPRVIAWQSSANNEIGYEWMLMDVIDSVPLFDVWRSVPWERKLKLVDEVAVFIKEMQSHTFDSIGALYFRSALGHETEHKADLTDAILYAGDSVDECLAQLDIARPREESLSKQSAPPLPQTLPDIGEDVKPENKIADTAICARSTASAISTKDDFAIGPIFDSLFFEETRPLLASYRGPYQNEAEWLGELIKVQQEWVKRGSVDEDPSYGKKFMERAPILTSLCEQYLSILDEITPEDGLKPSYILHHSDLNLANMLVDPETFDIRGIVDWEMVNVVPFWLAKEYPEFMQGDDPFEEEEPPIPSYEDEDDISVSTRDRWDTRLLRTRWDEAMKRLGEQDDSKTVPLENPLEMKVKKEFLGQIPNLTDVYQRAQLWLEKYRKRSSDHDEE